MLLALNAYIIKYILNICLDFPEFDWYSSLPPSLGVTLKSNQWKKLPWLSQRVIFFEGLKNEIFKNFQKNANSTHFVVLKWSSSTKISKHKWDLSVGSSRKADKQQKGSNWLAGCLLAQGGQEPEAPWMNWAQEAEALESAAKSRQPWFSLFQSFESFQVESDNLIKYKLLIINTIPPKEPEDSIALPAVLRISFPFLGVILVFSPEGTAIEWG